MQEQPSMVAYSNNLMVSESDFHIREFLTNDAVMIAIVLACMIFFTIWIFKRNNRSH